MNNSPPVVTLAAPLDGAKYRNGVPVKLTGLGDRSRRRRAVRRTLSWNVVLVHGNHLHPIRGPDGKSASFTPATDHDADSYYRVTLTATDSEGVSTAKTVTIRPRRSTSRSQALRLQARRSRTRDTR